MRKPTYSASVFLNCPFDPDYKPLQDAMVFTIYACGFIPRCALEEDDAGTVRIDKIQSLIESSLYGIHDICRTQLDDENQLPRFNMPLELGLFLGAKRYGKDGQRRKKCLILDCERYRYQKYVSDIAGQDIKAHDNSAKKAVSIVRDWLATASRRSTIPGGIKLFEDYSAFVADLPEICANADIAIEELTYNDYSSFAFNWLNRYKLQKR